VTRLLLLALALAARAAAEPPAPLAGVDARDLAYTYAVGPFAPEYTPPAPGTYELPVIDTVGDHALVDDAGRAVRLAAVVRGRVAVVAFVYTSCVEAAGCPLGQAVLQRLDRALAAEPALARRVTLVSVSFDPARDRPARLAAVRAAHRPQSDWRFATAADEAALAPLLDDFGQSVAPLRLPDGRWTGLYRHVLKVFLLDPERRVRNVYSAGFLHPELVLNDVRTLLLEHPGTPAPH
jgi:cytochrome c peroxidase